MKEKYLIIAGTNKAATTSLYEYLAAHPSVCPAFIKQTFFFLDKKWQEDLNLPSLYNYEEGLNQYTKFFRDCRNELHRLEASPEYIYAPGTAKRIYQFLQENNGEVIFTLRNPVSRLISLFYFGKQQGVIAQGCSFKEFLGKSINYRENANTSLMAYQTGFYSNYLEKYVEVFGTEKLKVYFFEDFMADNQQFMKKVAVDLSLDESFYDNFQFDVFNKTIGIKNVALSNVYKSSRAFIIKAAYKHRPGFVLANLLKKTITPLYRKVNMTKLKHEQIGVADVQFLTDAYKDEKNKLETLLNIKIPWRFSDNEIIVSHELKS